LSKAHKAFRIIIYSICLVISTSLIMYFLWNLSNNRLYHMGVPVGVVAVELLAQYFLSLGKSKVKAKQYLQGILLVMVYIFYVLLFGVLSAVGFFAAEISTNIQATTKTQQIDNMAQKRYNQIDDLIASLNLQMTTEAKTGYGRNSQTILSEIKRLKAEQSSLMDQMNKESKQIATAGPVDAFSALAKMIGVNANILAIIIFGSLCLFVYTGLTVCNPNLMLNETENTSNVAVKKKRFIKTVTNETENKTISETKIHETVICPICSKTFQSRNGKNYCSPTCRVKAFRHAKKEALGA
jgi:hypothetical protein